MNVGSQISLGSVAKWWSQETSRICFQLLDGEVLLVLHQRERKRDATILLFSYDAGTTTRVTLVVTTMTREQSRIDCVLYQTHHPSAATNPTRI